MKADEMQFLQILDGKRQFIMPIYQRTYSWKREHCEQLWNDIIRVATKEHSSHFIGSFVYVSSKATLGSTITPFTVIDGQQRLTSVLLLLIALTHASSNSSLSSEIHEQYIINKFAKGEQRYKVLLTQNDRELLIKLIDHPEQAYMLKATTPLIENFRFFQERIYQTPLNVTTIVAGIAKLTVVAISLDEHDSPHLIFESLNSTGKDLSPLDLIRNYVLMQASSEEQAELYQEYWAPMEREFLNDDEENTLLNRFIRDYLTLKQQAIPTVDKVYAEFKRYYQSMDNLSIKDLVIDIARFAEYFVHMALLQEPDPDIRSSLQDFNTLKIDVAYPFLLEVYDAYARKQLPKSDFIAIIKLLESYVFRRIICNIPTNSLNKLFATLGREIDRHRWLASTELALLAKSGKARFPNDEEFRAAFITRDVYNSPHCNYLLGKLENYQHKEPINPKNYTIEHILPQNRRLSAKWKQDLGPNWKSTQERYIHTIGNLTLTGYNANYSDKPFLQKKNYLNGGFAYCHLWLNESVAALDHWNQEEIEKRAQLLADRAVKVWAAPVFLGKDGVPMDEPANVKETPSPIDSAQSESILSDMYPHVPQHMLVMLSQLRYRILHLDTGIQETINEQHITYSALREFASVEPQKRKIKILLHIPYHEIRDPKKLCKIALGAEHYGDAETSLSSLDQLDDLMDLVGQALALYTPVSDAFSQSMV